MQSLLYGLFSESPWNSESVQNPYKIINDSLWAKLTCFPYNNIYIICYHYNRDNKYLWPVLAKWVTMSIFTLSIKRPSKWYIIYWNWTKMTELHLFEIDEVSKVRSALGTPLRKFQIKIILDVKSLFGALGLLDEGLMNTFLWKIWNLTKI